MINRPIEGVVAAATRTHAAFGQATYRHVTVRRADGREQFFPRLTVSERLSGALEPGTEGRFYFHDMAGTHGLHAFAERGGSPSVAYPRLLEHVFAAMAVINLGLVALWMSWTGALQLVPLMMGVLATTGWATCRGSRQAVLHDLRYENRLAARRTYRSAVMNSHA